jgi:hypothetical protein
VPISTFRPRADLPLVGSVPGGTFTMGAELVVEVLGLVLLGACGAPSQATVTELPQAPSESVERGAPAAPVRHAAAPPSASAAPEGPDALAPCCAALRAFRNAAAPGDRDHYDAAATACASSRGDDPDLRKSSLGAALGALALPAACR